MIQFEIPKNQSSIIKVVGVGGGGGNAANHMFNLGIEGVDFIICNTDAQAINSSPIPNKIQLGPNLTQGLGAGANPEIGKQASEESLEDITKILKVNTKMVFITAGMGGGTGTGGAPVIAKICKDLGILTVGIVSTPFAYEGRKRMVQAEEGINRLKENVDTLLIISNDKLRQQCGNMPFRQAFEKADDILATAAKCITDVITSTGRINVDFADVCTVMKNGGRAILGSAEASGEQRAQIAVEQALNSPLLNDNDIRGAKWILLNILSAEGEFEHTMDEAEIIQSYVQQQAGYDCDVILGMGSDNNLGDKISITVIATGFNYQELNTTDMIKKNTQPEKVVVDLNQNKTESKQQIVEPIVSENSKPEPTPTFELNTINSVDANDKAEEIVSNVWERNLSKLGTGIAVESATKQVENTPTKVEDKGAATQNEFKLIEKEPNIVTEQTTPFKLVERVLSEEEVEEKRQFEEQKRLLEERAERLRNLNFNINHNLPVDKTDLENVPAYLRRDVKMNDDESNKDTPFLSGYSVGVNQGNSNTANINTLNTFLDGKNPD